MILPTKMNGSEKRERMAIMEAAISSSLTHPNIVQTHTYSLTPVKEGISTPAQSNSLLSAQGPLSSATLTAFEVQIVLELCDLGTLRDTLNQRAFILPGGGVNYAAVLETAADVARGMSHLHSCNILHSDLKVGVAWPQSP